MNYILSEQLGKFAAQALNRTCAYPTNYVLAKRKRPAKQKSVQCPQDSEWEKETTYFGYVGGRILISLITRKMYKDIEMKFNKILRKNEQIRIR